MALRSIYLDADGVLCDLVGPVVRAHHREDLLAPGGWPKGVYSLEHLLNVTTEELWQPIVDQGAEFWEHLWTYHWAVHLVHYARQCSADVAVLTMPTACPLSHAGKYSWIRKHFQVSPENYVMTPQKWRLAGPGCLLIDDSEANIREWRNKGGLGLLFPQRWNHGTGTYKDVIDELLQLAR